VYFAKKKQGVSTDSDDEQETAGRKKRGVKRTHREMNQGEPDDEQETASRKKRGVKRTHRETNQGEPDDDAQDDDGADNNSDHSGGEMLD
jgi:hypothetical protein